jgi:hypothetical protein
MTDKSCRLHPEDERASFISNDKLLPTHCCSPPGKVRLTRRPSARSCGTRLTSYKHKNRGIHGVKFPPFDPIFRTLPSMG